MNKLFFRVVWVASLIIFASVFISPQSFWPAGLVTLLIPVTLIFHLIAFIYLAVKRSRMMVYSLSILGLGLLFLNRTVALHGPTDEDGELSLLSYNVRVFNVYSHLNEDFESSKKTINWVLSRNEDILCLQEFYYEPGSETFNTLQVIAKQHPYFYFHSKVTNQAGAQFGMAIFSKFPIINQGTLAVTENSMNDILYADLKVNSDTLRVYNMHLESMSIDENQLTGSSGENFSRNLGELLSQLRRGFTLRSEQIDQLINHLKSSPYPVILAGDLNDMPYSYSYQKLKRHLFSSFENAGRGFGFTFNGKLFFLRIDNQFFSEGLHIHRFETHQEIRHTDHHPISAVYSVE